MVGEQSRTKVLEWVALGDETDWQNKIRRERFTENFENLLLEKSKLWSYFDNYVEVQELVKEVLENWSRNFVISNFEEGYSIKISGREFFMKPVKVDSQNLLNTKGLKYGNIVCQGNRHGIVSYISKNTIYIKFFDDMECKNPPNGVACDIKNLKLVSSRCWIAKI